MFKRACFIAIYDDMFASLHPDDRQIVCGDAQGDLVVFDF